MSEKKSAIHETVIGIIGTIIVLGFLTTVPVLMVLRISTGYFGRDSVSYLAAWALVFGWGCALPWMLLEWVAELTKRRWLHFVAVTVLMSGASVGGVLMLTAASRYYGWPWFVHVPLTIVVVFCMALLGIKLWRGDFLENSSEE